MQSRHVVMNSPVLLLTAVMVMAMLGNLVVNTQGGRLLEDIAAIQVESATSSSNIEARQERLRREMHLALSKLDTLRRDTSMPEASRKQLALHLLGGLQYDQGDGYFYVYDTQGNCLLHPFLPEFVGTNRWDMTDSKGTPIIRQLIDVAKAHQDGGFTVYEWPKPSSGQIARKLGHSVLIEQWGWVIGTGAYLNDVEVAKSRIGDKSLERLDSITSLFTITGVISAGLLLVVLCWHVAHRAEDAAARAGYLLTQSVNDEVRAFLTAAHHALQFVLAGAYRDQAQLKQAVQQAVQHLKTADANLKQWTRKVEGETANSGQA